MKRLMLVAIALTISSGALVRAADNPIPNEYRKALEKAEALELYSLDPSAKIEKGDVDFHGYKVLGKTEVKKDSLAKLVTALTKGAEEQNQTISAGCFHPRHGLRVKFDGKTYDFVICFECVAVSLYQDKDEKSTDGFHVSRSPTEVFNKILKDAKVKLPEQPDD
jgi:hypothetical protein